MTTSAPFKVNHPFHGAVRKPPTEKHRPVLFEGILGTVYAVSPKGTVKYFDYDWPAARAFAEVDQASDLRVAAASQARNSWQHLWGLPGTLSRRQAALWVVRP